MHVLNEYQRERTPHTHNLSFKILAFPQLDIVIILVCCLVTIRSNNQKKLSFYFLEFGEQKRTVHYMSVRDIKTSEGMNE
jgi:hypothetical protein